MNKLKLAGFVSLFSLISANAYAVESFGWDSGSTTKDGASVYGTQGFPAPANTPGARNYATVGVDSSGAAWMFGGYGKDSTGKTGRFSDLWMHSYNTTDAQWEWTWVGSGASTDVNSPGFYGTKGVPSPMNWPSARQYAVQWMDTANNVIWLFGGDAVDGSGAQVSFGYFNDLWKYDIATSTWTWINGSNVKNASVVNYGTGANPGGRMQSVSWMDASGNLWLFGGQTTKGRMNDLWKYDPTTDAWTFVHGSTLGNQKGVYGAKGVADPNNNPGARILPTGWIDASGNFWMLGGYGNDYTAIGTGSLNDLWKYDVTADQWTWMTGAKTANQFGVYGTKGTGSSTTTPGGRYPLASWKDASGNFWMFGGLGYAASSAGYLNDFWKYDLTTGQWVWMSGANGVNGSGTWGTQGVLSTSNVVNARYGSAAWQDPASGHFFLFGGYGKDSASAYGYLNDVWEINVN